MSRHRESLREWFELSEHVYSDYQPNRIPKREDIISHIRELEEEIAENRVLIGSLKLDLAALSVNPISDDPKEEDPA